MENLILRLIFNFIPKKKIIKIIKGPNKGTKWIRGSSNRAECIGTYELNKQKEIMKYIKTGMIFYDIGANVGFYSLLARKYVGKEGKILAFEPFPRNAMFLLQHIKLNKFKNIEVHPYALSDKKGITSFKGGGYMGSISEEKCGLVVPTKKLDDFPTPDIVKIDVEGSEDKVLEGAKKHIKRNKTIWFVALHREEQRIKCLDILKNYEIKWIEKNEILALPKTL